jgi:hypothetical protein
MDHDTTVDHAHPHDDALVDDPTLTGRPNPRHDGDGTAPENEESGTEAIGA